MNVYEEAWIQRQFLLLVISQMLLEENDTTKKRICDGFPTIDVLPLLGSSTLKCVNTLEHFNPRISLLYRKMHEIA